MNGAIRVVARWLKSGVPARTRGLKTPSQLLWPLLLLPGLFGPAAAGTSETLFGPETFTRDTASPIAKIRTFAADSSEGAFTLVIENGDPATGADRVTSALVRLNGREVAVPKDFSKAVSIIERPVDLAAHNTLSVQVRGKPGTYLRIRVVAEYPNRPPTADAGPDQTAQVGDRVTLDGSASSDLDGNPLTFDWSFLSWPTGSAAALSDPTAVNPSFTLDRFGDYEIALTVNDGLADSAPDSVRVSTLNSPPVANAGPDQTGQVGDIVTLNGTGSTDVDGQPLTFLWTLTPAPGSGAALDDPAAVMPSFALDRPGTYIGALTVNDGLTDSAPDTVTITTENSPPVANAGPDQTVLVGATVTLDGGASSDVDGDPLSYSWSLSGPPGSGAALSDAARVTPSFEVDLPGTYVGQLIVNDGHVDSAPDTVAVTTESSRPLACIDAPQTAYVGDAVFLDGTCSSDADGDPLSFQWSLSSAPEGATPDLSGADADIAALVPDLPGLYVVQLSVCDGSLTSDPVTATITVGLPPVLNRDPEITSAPVTGAIVGQPYAYDVEASDPDGDTLSYGLVANPAGMTIDPASGLIQWTPAEADLAASPVAVSVQVDDGHGATDTQSFAIAVQPGTTRPIVPPLIGLTKAAAMVRISDAKLSLGAVTYTHDPIIPDGQVIDQAPAAGTPVDLGAPVALSVSLGPDQGLPPNPETVAPPLDPTVTTTLVGATEFLYTGDNPVQTGVAPGTIEEKRAAVIRGRVLDRASNPLPGVAITILNHPELGQTLSRADGMFDLAVNGGGYLVVDYRKAGYLPAQRQLEIPWQDYTPVDDVVLIQLDTQVTSIDLNAPVPMQIARGSVVTDKDGTRQATLLFPQGVEAQIYDADGNLQPISTLHFRATEYTVGDNGPQAMPAELPPTSAYTYAAELSVDEATRKVGGKDVLFSQPVPLYLDNFLNVGVGAYVPVGFYDRDKAAWVPDYDGRVVKILSIAGGIAELDTDGDGVADNGVALGVTEAERRELAGLYNEGKSLWRVALSHLSTVDLNFGGQPIQNPNQPPPEQPTNPPGCDEEGNSTIECQNQILHEEVAVTGTPFDLHYASDRTPGRLAANRLKIHLSGPTMPVRPNVWRILLNIEVAGRRFEHQYPAEPNLTHEFVWDGKDAMGRTLQGKQPVTVRIGWAYTTIYGQPYNSVDAGGGSRSFAFAPSGPLPGDVITRTPTYASQTFKTTIGAWDAKTAGLGGWTLDAHHAYDPVGQTLYLGNGERRSAVNANDSATLLETASMNAPSAVAGGADGSVYVKATYCPGSSCVGEAIWRVDAAGGATRVAGGGTQGCDASDVPATEIYLANYWSDIDFVIGPKGDIYIADSGCALVRKVDVNGMVKTVAGIGRSCNPGEGEGGPATEACLDILSDIALAPDGTLYVGSFHFANRSWHSYVRRVDTDGVISLIAPTYVAGGEEVTLAAAPDGALYMARGYYIDRLSPGGQVTRFAGTGVNGFGGDGGPATSALFQNLYDLAVGPDGSLFVADANNGRIRRVDSEGIIDTVVGGGSIVTEDASVKMAPARQIAMREPTGVGVGPDVVFATSRWHNVWRIGSPLPSFTADEIAIASEDGNELYKFSPEGRHLETLNALTGATLHRFGYDAAGRLASITDGDGNLTTIERLGDGTPTAILAPFGQRTALALGADGYLSGIADPAGNAYAFTYRAGGLLETLTDPNGHTTGFA